MQNENILHIRELIKQKKYSYPTNIYETDAKAVITPYNVFPYDNWFKGNFLSTEPIVAEREAGYCKITEKPKQIFTDKNPELCFQTACSLVKPCVSNEDSELSLPLNKNCCNTFI